MTDYRPLGRQFSSQLGLDWNLVDKFVTQESVWQQFTPSGQVLTSRAGALGLTQLMPETAASLGVNPRDPIQNLRGGLTYLAQMLKRYSGNVARALVGYNAGPRTADAWDGMPSMLPLETRQYLNAILGSGWYNGQPVDNPGNDSSGSGLLSVVQQWIQQISGGAQTAARDILVQKYAGPLLGISGIILLGIGIFALVMKTPAGPAVAEAGSKAAAAALL